MFLTKEHDIWPPQRYTWMEAQIFRVNTVFALN